MAAAARRFTVRRVVLVPLVGALALAGAACSSEGSGTSSSYSAPGDAAAPAAPAIGGAAPAKAPESAGSAAPAQNVPVTDRQLTRSVTLRIEVADSVAAAVGRVRTEAVAAGGYVSQEQTSDSSSSIVLQVPAAALDRTVDELAGIGEVTSRRSDTSDVTDTVVDLDARVKSQQASVDRVRQLLAKATSIGDVVAIESELAQREADLDSLTSRLAAVRGEVALSTITVTLSTPSGATPADRSGNGFLDGLATGWDAVRALVVALGAILGFLLPFLPVFALVIGAIVLIRRSTRARRPAAPAPVAPVANGPLVGAASRPGPGGQGGPGPDGES